MIIVRRLSRWTGLVAGLAAFAPCVLHGQAVTNESQEQVHAIDLPTALRLAHAQNLDIQIAYERLNEAKAAHTGAMEKFLPWMSLGWAQRRHEGRTQAVDGTLLDVDKQSISYGPTVTAQLDIGDAIYSSLAAKRRTDASSFAFEAQQQDSTLSAAQGYFELLKAKALVNVTEEALNASEDYQRQIGGAVRAGIVFKGDELRVQTQTERFRTTLIQARQQQRAASAKLAEVLHLDPLVELSPQEGDLVPMTLVDTSSPPEMLAEKALDSRPEIKQSASLVDAARSDRNNSVYGPLIPSLGVQAFVGQFGGGRDDAAGNFGSSKDYFLGLSWRIGPGGLFDFGRINASKARLHTAELSALKTADAVRRQVIEGYTRVKSLSEQITATRQSLDAATETLRLTRERKQLGVGIVLEDIQAQQEVARTRADFVSAIAEFNKAQYELNKALGTNAGGATSRSDP